MKLSELIAFRNRLKLLPVSKVQDSTRAQLDIIAHTVKYPLEEALVPVTNTFIPQVEQRYADIQQSFENFSFAMQEVFDAVQKQIREQEKHFFSESYRLFEAAQTCETTHQILYGRTPTGIKQENTLQAEATLRARLAVYSDWRFPGIIIRPGAEDFVDTMVGADPLYIIDRNHDLLKPCLNRYPQIYQNRLRPYTVDEWSDQLLLEKIPNNQFGVCLVSNVFNYRPLEIIRRYLNEIYTKLKPGGALLMSFNDCDLEKAVMLVEQFCASYTPGYLIRDLVKIVGFEIITEWSDGGPSVWLELKKPGELTSLRGGQSIARLRSMEDYLHDIDFVIRRHYNEEELDELRAQVIEFGATPAQIVGLKSSALLQLAQELYPAYLANEEIRNEERERKNAEELQRHLERERQRVAELHERARSYGIDPEMHRDETEIHRLIAEEIDTIKKVEMKELRAKALELGVGDPNLVKYGYSAEKLKHLINAKEQEQK